jgi:hypothetical protein
MSKRLNGTRRRVTRICTSKKYLSFEFRVHGKKETRELKLAGQLFGTRSRLTYKGHFLIVAGCAVTWVAAIAAAFFC